MNFINILTFIRNRLKTMQLIKELTTGRETIDPFLKDYGVEFEEYHIDKGPDGYFAFTSYRNDHKKNSY
jgi:hypothetical protein